MKKISILTFIVISVFSFQNVFSQCGPTDHGGADWIISSSTTIGGEHVNVGTFRVELGITVTVDTTCHFLTVYADSVFIYGTIDADAAGDDGGSGGAGGPYANGSGVPGHGGDAGLTGYGTGGGPAGTGGGDGGYQTQICGGVFCVGNRDGFNGGGGGAGGGAGGSYGGTGGGGGYGAFGSGFSVADGGDYGPGGTAASSFGTETGSDISWGSGGGGAGGGGGGYNYGTVGGFGGHGGGMVSLIASYKLIMSGTIHCNGEAGGDGGNGGGESTDAGYDCSTSGYSSCSVCPESVYDAAGGAGGGAGGGSGGGIYLQSDGALNVTGTLEAIGGIGGAAGIPDNTYGTCFDYSRGGGGGGGGRIKILYNPCVMVNISPSYNVNGGTGGSGVTAGSNGSTGTYRGDIISVNYSVLDAGSIGLTDPVFCDYGDVPPISSTGAASGGLAGNYHYQWEYSTTDSLNGFVNLPGETGITCDPGLITQTTWYRRKVESGECEEYTNAVRASVIDCSAIDENNAMLQMQVYPNPNSGEFTITTSQPIDNNAFIRIYSSSGQIVFEKSDLNNQKEIKLHLSAEPGIYYLILESGEQKVLTRFSIQ
ncbi:MAG: hypothetical protein C0592_06155 [Marinilabiliales bacterium]|nr:MAG: hypothetical protein C0592_06155 [Marinilabiliales bacterium]